MGARHRRRNRLLTTSTAGAVLAAGPAVIGVLLLSAPGGAPVGVDSQPKPVAQQGRVVAVSAGSLTAQSADGSARTYVVTPETTSVTAQRGESGSPFPFAVHDEVSIVGELREGTAVATVVAAQEVSNLDGPPMDAIAYYP